MLQLLCWSEGTTVAPRMSQQRYMQAIGSSSKTLCIVKCHKHCRTNTFHTRAAVYRHDKWLYKRTGGSPHTMQMQCIEMFYMAVTTSQRCCKHDAHDMLQLQNLNGIFLELVLSFCVLTMFFLLTFLLSLPPFSVTQHVYCSDDGPDSNDSSW